MNKKIKQEKQEKEKKKKKQTVKAGDTEILK